MSFVSPINHLQQQQVVERVNALLKLCEQHYARKFKPIEMHFDLRGRASGMYVLKNRDRYFRFNAFVFAKYFEDCLTTTVPHEVAHYVSDVLYGIKNIRPHGKEWKSIMHFLGVAPQVTGNYDLTGVPIKKQRRFDYACACMTHQLSSTRHNKILKKNINYLCKKCGQSLRQAIVIETA